MGDSQRSNHLLGNFSIDQGWTVKSISAVSFLYCLFPRFYVILLLGLCVPVKKSSRKGIENIVFVIVVKDRRHPPHIAKIQKYGDNKHLTKNPFYHMQLPKSRNPRSELVSVPLLVHYWKRHHHSLRNKRWSKYERWEDNISRTFKYSFSSRLALEIPEYQRFQIFNFNSTVLRPPGQFWWKECRR